MDKPMSSQWTLPFAALAAIAAFSLAPGCSGGPTVSDNPVLVNPETTQKLSGGTDDIYEATQFVIDSLSNSQRVRQQAGNRVALNTIINQTGIPDYDENIIYNRFLSALIESSDKLVFLSRESVQRERERQLSGQVQTSGLEAAPKGADMMLDIELRQNQGARTQAIQYTFRLTNLGGEILWQADKIILKKR
ncbi:MAG TPA: hypothetical protein VMT52_14275 [Planctomycetota bacterium]|nr:hypothetical protein [Planctomycetota bacterium]